MLQAAANAEADTILFGLPTDAVQVISLQTPLPVITGALQIDATSLIRENGSLGIELDGSGIEDEANGLHFGQLGSGSAKGLSLHSFSGHGILIEGHVSVASCFVGVDASGTVAKGNGGDGIHASSGAFFAVTGAPNKFSIISGNAGNGIYSASSQTTIQRSFVGTDITGTLDFGNSGHGVHITSGNATISALGDRNIISGNGGSGVVVEDVQSLVLESTYIGTNSSGSGALGNDGNGVEIRGNVANIRIGGLTGIWPNAISSNGLHGILVDVEEAMGSGVVIQDNRIGVTAEGFGALGNGGNGITVEGGGNVYIDGGTERRQVIAGNVGHGIEVIGTNNVQIGSNLIGVYGDKAIGNGGDGVRIAGDAFLTKLTLNIISGNVEAGIRVLDSAHSVSIEGNTIGADLSGTKAMPNQVGIHVETTGSHLGIGGNSYATGNFIGGNSKSGIVIAKAGNSISINDNGIGVNRQTLTPLGNGDHGILIPADAVLAAGMDIGGTRSNLIGANGGDGIRVLGGSDVAVSNSYIGVTDHGLPRGNAGTGVYIQDSPRAVLLRNVIGMNGGHGIHLTEGANGVKLEGNMVGISFGQSGPGGAYTPSRNGGDGVLVDGARGVAIGTVEQAQSNIIAANEGAGIRFRNVPSGIISGAWIGTFWNESAGFGNGGSGIAVENSEAVLIENAIVANNGEAGIHVLGSTGISIRGGAIGLSIQNTGSVEEVAVVGNGGPSILIDGSSGTNVMPSGVSVAGSKLDPAPFITLVRTAEYPAIEVLSGTENQFVGLRISGSDGLPIDLGGDGVTANDVEARDTDSGPNNFQNSPQIVSATIQRSPNLEPYGLITGNLQSAPNKPYSIEFYRLEDGAWPSIGKINVQTDSGGVAAFSFEDLLGEPGDQVAMIATSMATRDTSEFSSSVVVAREISVQASTESLVEGNAGKSTVDITFTVSLPFYHTTVVPLSLTGSALAGVDFDLLPESISFEPGETTKTVTVSILGDTLVEPNEMFQLTPATSETLVLLQEALPTVTILNDDTSVLISKNGKTAKWIDVDGGLVTLKSNKGILDRDDFVFEVSGELNGERLVRLDLSGADDHPKKSAPNLSFTEKERRTESGKLGNKTVDIGEIDVGLFSLGNVSVAGDLQGLTAVNVKNLKARSLGAVTNSAGEPQYIQLTGKLGTLAISGDVRAMHISAQSIGAVTIAGSIHGSLLGESGIFALGRIGPVKVKGSITGASPESPVMIQASGASDRSPYALQSLTVKGDVENAVILAGNSSLAGESLGPIKVSGDWRSSVAAASIDPGADGRYGTADDRLGGTAPGDAVIKAIARLARVDIGGLVSGTLADEDSFGFFAQRVGPVRVGGILIPQGLVPGSSDVRIAEIVALQS